MARRLSIDQFPSGYTPEDKIHAAYEKGAKRRAWTSGGTGSGDMLKATYDTDLDGVVDNAENVTLGAIASAALPVASATYAGQFRYVKDGGAAGVLYFCIQASGGAYEWQIVSIASS